MTFVLGTTGTDYAEFMLLTSLAASDNIVFQEDEADTEVGPHILECRLLCPLAQWTFP